MIDEKLLKNEIYKIPYKNKTIFYAPLTRFFALSTNSIGINQKWLNDATNINNIPNFIRDKSFSYDTDKIRLRLNITTECNLKCTYCSVRAGEKNNTNMTENIAISAIDGFCKLAIQNHGKTLELVYSGGEPTLKIHFIKKTIKYAKKKLTRNTNLNTRILTNGLFNQKEFSQIINQINGVQISWDGFFEKNQRYGTNAKTASIVWKNIGFLIKHGVSVTILVVVSETNSKHLRQIVDELYNYGVKNIFLSLKDNIGRATKNEKLLNYIAIGKIYFKIWKDYRRKGLDINLTGTDIHSVSSFPCSVPVPNYSVAPNGKISACTTNFNDKNTIADIFNIGNVIKNGINLNTCAIESVRQFNIFNLSKCSQCFAKWHCRGGCIYSKKGDWTNTLHPRRCDMIKDVIAHKLFHIITNPNE